MTWPGKARRGSVWQAGQGAAGLGWARRDMAGEVRCGWAWYVEASYA